MNFFSISFACIRGETKRENSKRSMEEDVFISCRMWIHQWASPSLPGGQWKVATRLSLQLSQIFHEHTGITQIPDIICIKAQTFVFP